MYKNIILAKSMQDEPNLFTHTAPHHADEIFATAMLSFILEPVVLRTRDVKVLSDCDGVVYDVGGVYDTLDGRYDHHQSDFTNQRASGIRYASAGLIWEAYGFDILRSVGIEEDDLKQVFQIVDDELISGIDANDNGQIEKTREMSISTVISLFNTNWEEEDKNASEAGFLKACGIAQEVLLYEIKRVAARVRGKHIIRDAIDNSDGKILVMDRFIGGWIEEVMLYKSGKSKSLLFGIYQSTDGNYGIRAIPPSLSEQMKQRKAFPHHLRGLSGEELAEKTGIKTAVFCHKAGFYAVTKTKEDAILFAKLAMES